MTSGLPGGCVKSLGAWYADNGRDRCVQVVPDVVVRQMPRFATGQDGFEIPGNSRTPATMVVELTKARSEMKQPLIVPPPKPVVPPTLAQVAPPFNEW